jgi:hypothetical protein
MEWVITVITISAAVVTIVWFVRDIRKENSKVLKAILDTEKIQAEILAKIEEGQRKGFETLAQLLAKETTK